LVAMGDWASCVSDHRDAVVFRHSLNTAMLASRSFRIRKVGRSFEAPEELVAQ